MARAKPKKPKDKIRGKTRIVTVMAVLMRRDFRDGVTQSLFAYEGVFIATMRSDLCLTGWPWAVADQAARDVVGEALRQAGAKRPSWYEGQRAYTQTDVTRDSCCRQCGGSLKGQQVSFCSSPCRSRWWALTNAEAA